MGCASSAPVVATDSGESQVRDGVWLSFFASRDVRRRSFFLEALEKESRLFPISSRLKETRRSEISVGRVFFELERNRESRIEKRSEPARGGSQKRKGLLSKKGDSRDVAAAAAFASNQKQKGAECFSFRTREYSCRSRQLEECNLIQSRPSGYIKSCFRAPKQGQRKDGELLFN
jgi:hypothetical protein